MNFSIPEKVLEGKARKLRNAGKGKLPNKSRSLTREEEEALWESGQLGNSSPRSLMNTMWWLLPQHFGLRGCQEHYTMNVEDFTLNKDDNGNEFVTFAEIPTKTRQRGLRVQPQGPTQSVCVADSYFIVNVLELPFRLTYSHILLTLYVNQKKIYVELPYLWCKVVLLPQKRFFFERF